MLAAWRMRIGNFRTIFFLYACNISNSIYIYIICTAICRVCVCVCVRSVGWPAFAVLWIPIFYLFICVQNVAGTMFIIMRCWWRCDDDDAILARMQWQFNKAIISFCGVAFHWHFLYIIMLLPRAAAAQQFGRNNNLFNLPYIFL